MSFESPVCLVGFCFLILKAVHAPPHFYLAFDSFRQDAKMLVVVCKHVMFFVICHSA